MAQKTEVDHVESLVELSDTKTGYHRKDQLWNMSELEAWANTQHNFLVQQKNKPEPLRFRSESTQPSNHQKRPLPFLKIPILNSPSLQNRKSNLRKTSTTDSNSNLKKALENKLKNRCVRTEAREATPITNMIKGKERIKISQIVKKQPIHLAYVNFSTIELEEYAKQKKKIIILPNLVRRRGLCASVTTNRKDRQISI